MPINQSIPNLESLCNPNSKNSSNITHYDWLNENEALCTLLYANPLQSSYSGWVRAPCDNCISLHLRTSIPPPLHLCTSICKSAAPQYANQLHLKNSTESSKILALFCTKIGRRGHPNTTTFVSASQPDVFNADRVTNNVKCVWG